MKNIICTILVKCIHLSIIKDKRAIAKDCLTVEKKIVNLLFSYVFS